MNASDEAFIFGTVYAAAYSVAVNAASTSGYRSAADVERMANSTARRTARSAVQDFRELKPARREEVAD